MKVTDKNETCFRPVTIEITIRHPEELVDLLARVDVAASALIRVFGEHGNTRYDKYPPNSRAYPLFSVLNRYAIKYGLVEE